MLEVRTMRGLWQFTAVCAVLGGLVILMAIGAEGAPQQAAGAAIGVGMAVAPYVYTHHRNRRHRKCRTPLLGRRSVYGVVWVDCPGLSA